MEKSDGIQPHTAKTFAPQLPFFNHPAQIIGCFRPPAFIQNGILFSCDVRIRLQISQCAFFPLGFRQFRRLLLIHPPQRHRTQTVAQFARRPETDIPKMDGFGPYFLVFKRTMRQNGTERPNSFEFHIPSALVCKDIILTRKNIKYNVIPTKVTDIKKQPRQTICRGDLLF